LSIIVAFVMSWAIVAARLPTDRIITALTVATLRHALALAFVVAFVMSWTIVAARLPTDRIGTTDAFTARLFTAVFLTLAI
jgi:hypothetical protein